MSFCTHNLCNRKLRLSLLRAKTLMYMYHSTSNNPKGSALNLECCRWVLVSNLVSLDCRWVCLRTIFCLPNVVDRYVSNILLNVIIIIFNNLIIYWLFIFLLSLYLLQMGMSPSIYCTYVCLQYFSISLFHTVDFLKMLSLM